MLALCGQENFTLLVDEEATVWATGINKTGQLGLGDNLDRNMFTKVPGLPPIAYVSCSSLLSLFLDEQGQIWEYGITDSTNKTLMLLPGLPKIASMACGEGHSLFQAADGSVWGKGSNSSFQLGLPQDDEPICAALQLERLPPIIRVSCGLKHSTFLDNSGCVWMCGSVQYKTKSLFTIERPTKFTILPKITRIASGAGHSLFLDELGSVWGVGINSFGQLGTNNSKPACEPQKMSGLFSPIASIACGANHSILLDADGKVYSCGRNHCGQLGLGSTVQKVSATRIELIPKIRAIVCGSQSNGSVFVDEDNRLWACGDDSLGQLGNARKRYVVKYRFKPRLFLKPKKLKLKNIHLRVHHVTVSINHEQ